MEQSTNESLSPSQLAERLGVVVTTISNWTTKRPPLRSDGQGRQRRYTWNDYLEFAKAHPELRSIVRVGGPGEPGSLGTPQEAANLTKMIAILERVLKLTGAAASDTRHIRRTLQRGKKSIPYPAP